ncbi:glycosyltransferase family 2 protein [Pseudolysinimonas sp.]|jgi:N-acetylglucosaminyl-diphospho-decaprenol L-rhamnosyltransferase|uniref:glycosyltransferase family 2 protein n=1 Tax=Pseudolysinimonas sp. TaxID=2680009 RepID=UPI0037832136
MSARLAVITVSYHSGRVLTDFLESVARSTVVPGDILIVNNATDDAGVADFADASRSIRVVEAGGNLGYGGAINAGVAALAHRPEWIVVANPDIELRPDTLSLLLRAAEEDDRIAIVGPRIEDAEGVFYPSARSAPSLRTGIGHALFAGVWPGNPWTRAYRQDRIDTSLPRDADWVSGACFLMRRDAFEELEGFDSAYFMYFEDVDLGQRAHRLGWRVVYEPCAVVRHEGAHSTSTAASSARMLREHHRSAARYLRRRYSGWYLWPVRVAVSAGLEARLLLLRALAMARRR